MLRNGLNVGRVAQASYFSFDTDNGQASVDNIRSATNQDLQIVIDYYKNRAGRRWWFSGVTRWVAITAAVASALAINPIVQKWLGFIKPEDLLNIISVFIAVAGFFLSIDWAFSVTKKYTDWTIIAFQLAIEKDEFNLAFDTLAGNSAPNKDLFQEAKRLCLDTVKEFDEKCLEETQDWAANLTAILKTLNSKHSTLSDTHKNASKKIIDELAPNLGQFGLTVSIAEAPKRTGKNLSLEILQFGNNTNAVREKVNPGEEVSTVSVSGRYILNLLNDEFKMSSKVINLNKDTRITI